MPPHILPLEYVTSFTESFTITICGIPEYRELLIQRFVCSFRSFAFDMNLPRNLIHSRALALDLCEAFRLLI